MTEDQLKNIAAQLRKPAGVDGVRTADLMSAVNKQIIFDTFRALHAEGGNNILEIGMGNGLHVKDILERSEGIQYNGCDYSQLMVEESEKINAAWINQGRASFIHCEASSLPFPDRTFNKVFTINTIYFWDNIANTLDEIKRVLQPGGKLIIGFRPRRQMEKYPFKKYGFTQFSKEDVESILKDNGLSIEQSILKM